MSMAQVSFLDIRLLNGYPDAGNGMDRYSDSSYAVVVDKCNVRNSVIQRILRLNKSYI